MITGKNVDDSLKLWNNYIHVPSETYDQNGRIAEYILKFRKNK